MNRDSGHLTSEFSAFQPTNIEGGGDVEVQYTCLLTVCKGKCEKETCEDPKRAGRKRRDTEERDRITCGTSVKVKTQKEIPLKEEQESKLCMEKIAAFPVLAATGLIILGSWLIIARLARKVMIMEGKHDSDIGVARSVGRRISSVFNLPTGYNFRSQNILTTIPEYEGITPPQQRRKSVTVTNFCLFLSFSVLTFAISSILSNESLDMQIIPCIGIPLD
ncbi:hypothetical protein FSP39_015516 [Pinctada imbricata]|uniref:ZP domain-containing protein n=1 Tax=Pinctada imbricata TaxID=66713 RepID=A0AA88Y0M4_PINIB|nr:hypothetical protein FSP39_015516 [Pinctada imbricata]